jgi:competence protein ComEA
MDKPSTTLRRAYLSAERGAVGLIVLLLAVLAGLWVVRRGAWQAEPGVALSQPAGDYLRRIDPNTASWQALACLPGLGEVRARAIVAHRERAKSRPAFAQPDDLCQVRGIGPKTVAQLTPFLAFPTTEPDQ